MEPYQPIVAATSSNQAGRKPARSATRWLYRWETEVP